MDSGRASIVTRAALLLGLSMALGLAANAVRPNGVGLRSFAAPTICATTGAAGAASAAPPLTVVAPEDAVGLCGDPQTVIADVRPAGEFAQGHVTGAIHLPCAASGSVADAAAGQLGGRRTLIVYGDDTADAQVVADEMRRRINRADLRVLVLAGGFPAWSRAGLACSSGPCPDCQAQKVSSP
ncbi:MAG TPA: rhodanese-like domain-containing protein [Polyangia bacterium]|jgi:rhodanese-related sulfurtransferase|nr:rhodanese-like domain-containing protein [Polyangia bacterium]